MALLLGPQRVALLPLAECYKDLCKQLACHYRDDGVILQESNILPNRV